VREYGKHIPNIKKQSGENNGTREGGGYDSFFEKLNPAIIKRKAYTKPKR